MKTFLRLLLSIILFTTMANALYAGTDHGVEATYTLKIGESQTLQRRWQHYPDSWSRVNWVIYSSTSSGVVSISYQDKDQCTIEAKKVGSARIDCQMYYYGDISHSYYDVIVVSNGKLTITSSTSGKDLSPGESINVKLSSNQTDAKIYYTLNGNTPTTSSTLYTSAGITINSACTLKAFAVKNGWTDSDVFSATFRISDSFTAKTAEGVDMKFKYIDADSKTCEVASNCIDESTSGKVTIPSSVNGFKVVRIGKSAFNGCASLTTVVIPSTVVELASGAFLNCSGLTTVTIPNGVTSIDSQAFERCSSLTSVTIPNSVTSIGHYAFYKCSGLTSVTIPNSVTSIGDQSFDGCTGLTSLTIPNSVTSIGRFAFSGCTNLTSVTIPNSVTSIGVNAFNKCSGLKSIKILASDLETGAYAFSGLEKLEELTINLKRLSFSSWGLANLESLRCFTCSKDLEYIDGVTYLDASPWANNLPDGLNYIGKVLYKYKGTMPSGTKINIADGCTQICDNAFYEQPGLAELNIPSSVTSIGRVIAWCDGLNKITIDAQNPVYDSRDNCNAIIEKATNSLISGCTGTTIPSSVTSIGNLAFRGNTTWEEIVIPNQIDSLGISAFWQNINVKSIIVDKGLRKIGTGAFRRESNLKEIIVSASNPYFDSRDNCNAIIETATNTLVVGCTNTKIPNTVKVIGSGAFHENGSNYEDLNSIVIPNSVEEIGGSAFKGLTYLTTVTIGSNVKKIESSAFGSCPNINTIISLNGFPEDIKETAFDSDVYNNATLYVPEGCRNNYRVATGWSNFKNIVEGIPDGIDNVKITPYDAKRIYTPSGTSTTTVNKGINIINGKKYVVK